MGLLDYVAAPTQRVAYLFPEASSSHVNIDGPNGVATNGATKLQNIFIFQFWPQQVQDNYTPNYATKNIPGASHPIYQWTSGSGRDISFTAQFVSEVNESNFADSLSASGTFRDRIAAASATTTKSPDPGGGLGSALGALLLPSARYIINVSAAIAALQQYLYPTYGTAENKEQFTRPPKKLVLVLPGTNLGRRPGHDGVLCIMRNASVTQEAWFPDGTIRSASVSLKFSEIIQYSNGADVSKIKYIGSESYTELANKYLSQAVPNELELG